MQVSCCRSSAHKAAHFMATKRGWKANMQSASANMASLHEIQQAVITAVLHVELTSDGCNRSSQDDQRLDLLLLARAELITAISSASRAELRGGRQSVVPAAWNVRYANHGGA